MNSWSWEVNRGQVLSLSQCENIGASVEASPISNPKQIFLYAQLDCTAHCHAALLVKYLQKLKKQQHIHRSSQITTDPEVLRCHKSLERFQEKSLYGLALFLYIPESFDFWGRCERLQRAKRYRSVGTVPQTSTIDELMISQQHIATNHTLFVSVGIADRHEEQVFELKAKYHQHFQELFKQNQLKMVLLY